MKPDTIRKTRSDTKQRHKGTLVDKQGAFIKMYHDYAHEPDCSKDEQSQQQGTTTVLTNGNHCEQKFPVKLHYLIDDMKDDGLDHIISWQPHGRCFHVHKPHELAEKILPL